MSIKWWGPMRFQSSPWAEEGKRSRLVRSTREIQLEGSRHVGSDCYTPKSEVNFEERTHCAGRKSRILPYLASIQQVQLTSFIRPIM